MSDDKGFTPEYDDSKKSNTIYFGNVKTNPDSSTYRKVELIVDEPTTYLSEKNKDDNSSPVDFEIKEDIILFESPGGQQKIHCWLMENASRKRVTAIHISRRTSKGVYGSQEVTLSLGAAIAFRDFLKKLFVIDSSTRTTIPIESFNNKSNFDSQKLISEQEFHDLIKANIKSTDDFYTLVSIQKMELSIERLEEIMDGAYKNEVEIQRFLKANLWMFGNDYAYVIENNKINPQNILDIIPQDFESYVDIIEVKLPKEILFNYDESHNNYYPTSHLTKAIAQTQNYIFELEKLTADKQYQEENGCKIIRPKGIIIFGAKKTLQEEEKRYLRILNASYHNLLIITYQQLLQKAKNTVQMLKTREKEKIM